MDDSKKNRNIHNIQNIKIQNALINKILIGFIISAFFFGCASVPPPVEDYALAQTALEGARKAEASRFAPILFQQAEVNYLKAQNLYDEKDYIGAEKEFIKTRKLAEKAENQSRVQKAVQGEAF